MNCPTWVHGISFSTPVRSHEAKVLSRKWKTLLPKWTSSLQLVFWKKKTNVVSFNYYLHCLAFSKRLDGGERCEAVLSELQAKWKSGDEDLKPSPQTYGLAIQAWLLRNNCEQAQKLLFEMRTSFENGDAAMKPYLETFRSVLDAVVKQEGGGEANAGEKIREKMKMMYPELLDLKLRI